MKEKKLRYREKGYIKTYVSGFIRAFVIALLLLMQFAIVFLLSYYLSLGVYVYYGMVLVSVLVIIGLVNEKTNSSFKIGWLTMITLVPFAGLVMYLLWGANRSKKIKMKNLSFIQKGYKFLEPNDDVMKSFSEHHQESVNTAAYLEHSHFPLFGNSRFRYFSMGDDAFEAIIDDLQKAERFIFIDFFIVADGILWNKIKGILLDKVKSGIEIKFLYDDYGSMFRTSKQLWQELNDAGIETAEFNSIGKYLDKLYLNYRSHQKIVVIDGKVGYTGGFNLADEYVNAVTRFGIWKDNGVRIEGEGVFGLTATFLQMWTMTTEKAIEDYNIYRYDFSKEAEITGSWGGFCQIVADGPANNPESPILDMILQLIYGARDILYLTTPYLVLDDDIKEALAIAAKRGLDVRLLTPGIPDKKIVHLLTRHNYGYLLENGVRVFEYSPGFLHEKTIVTDKCALVGTINLDFRSLFIHYECGALMWEPELVKDVTADIFDTLEDCKEITYEDWKKTPFFTRVIQNFFSLFSSLM